MHESLASTLRIIECAYIITHAQASVRSDINALLLNYNLRGYCRFCYLL